MRNAEMNLLIGTKLVNIQVLKCNIWNRLFCGAETNFYLTGQSSFSFLWTNYLH